MCDDSPPDPAALQNPDWLTLSARLQDTARLLRDAAAQPSISDEILIGTCQKLREMVNDMQAMLDASLPPR